MPMLTEDVVIVGGGPNGLMLACELALAGVRPVVLEGLTAPSEEPKANGLLGQVVKMIDRRGLYERLGGAPGPPKPNAAYFMFAALPLNLSLLPDSPVYGLPVPQRHLVQVLEERATELGVDIRRGHEVVALSYGEAPDGELVGELNGEPDGEPDGEPVGELDGARSDTRGDAQDGAAVTVDIDRVDRVYRVDHADRVNHVDRIVHVDGVDGPYRLRARYVVGADGAHSITRKLSGIGFPGVSYDRRTTRTAHATVPAAWVDAVTGALNVPGYGSVLPFLPHRTEHGGFSYAPFPGHPPLISTTEWDQPTPRAPMSLDELGASVRRVLGADLPLAPPTGEGPQVLRRLTGGNTRVAERFRDGRVFLVGDAAHVYAEGGGPGLNLGLQDAVNLGWKLAAALRGGAPPHLLDSYGTERRRAAHRMVVSAQAQAALTAPGSDTTALRELFTELLGHPHTVQHLADLTAGADIRYGTGDPDAHPLTGRFAPDMELHTPDGTDRLAELTPTARPLLLDMTEDASAAKALAEWHGVVDIVTARPHPAVPTTPPMTPTPATPPPTTPATAPTTPPTPTATVMLLRPDCYVAWATDSPAPDPADLTGLRAAARWWFGNPAE